MPNFCLGDAIFYLSIRTFLGAGRWDMDITGYDFVFMTVESICYFIIALVIEKVNSMPEFWNYARRAARRMTPEQMVSSCDERLDPDVAAEKKRVQEGGAAEDLIKVLGLLKMYPPRKFAVKGVHFGIPAGQCFGFLGVNGAGKTTTLRMLTGDELPSVGTAKLGPRGGCDILAQVESV